ncbi:hypothetical protein ROTAS13_03053 [Roseomonas sp. TAS13]|nr:hypothetical protein ROTAS13_03053 [Roseomonas sp. TAS13]
MSSGISGTGISMTSPVSALREQKIRCVASIQMPRSSSAKRMVSMLIGTPLWSRIQTSTGAMVPIKAMARARNTPLLSLACCSPSWLASSSRIASALPAANGLKVLLSLIPLAVRKLSASTSSSRPNDRARA